MSTTENQDIFHDKDNYSNGNMNNSQSIDDKIKEIENRIRNLYDNKIPEFLNVNQTSKEDTFLKDKLEGVHQNIKQFSTDLKTKSPDLKIKSEVRKEALVGSTTELEQSQKESQSEALEDIDEKIGKLDSLTSDENLSETEKKFDDKVSDAVKKLEDKIESRDNDLHKKLFDSFYEETAKPEVKENIVKDKLERIDEQIKDIKNSISSLYTDQKVVSSSAVEGRLKQIEEKLDDDKTQSKLVPHGAITLRPKEKKEGLFNDVNLTEDYELGFRFYQLGFKTGFFNVKLDKDDEASRIATAEFFPNTFWSSVKQRSRWVAGIVFQNWKAHKWAGNTSTKYFLFRDRKSIFSFVSAFLSNIVIMYFLYSITAKIFNWPHVTSLVGHSSVLWWLMIANLVFMISRLSHRFVFTYNWYGFKYAFFSIFRLPLDTIINFFAIARSVSVYKNIKSKNKVVWDSTAHY
ncbi:MAG: glycosyltransferase family 2 protein [Ignavibacteria bacterium]